jgi:hypothetical protein
MPIAHTHADSYCYCISNGRGNTYGDSNSNSYSCGNAHCYGNCNRDGDCHAHSDCHFDFDTDSYGDLHTHSDAHHHASSVTYTNADSYGYCNRNGDCRPYSDSYSYSDNNGSTDASCATGLKGNPRDRRKLHCEMEQRKRRNWLSVGCVHYRVFCQLPARVPKFGRRQYDRSKCYRPGREYDLLLPVTRLQRKRHEPQLERHERTDGTPLSSHKCER